MMKYTKENPLRVMTLFSGYDSQCLALDRLKALYPAFDYELVAWCEIDAAAIRAHDALYPQWAGRNIGDIAKADAKTLPDCDLVTWSFPCTDISVAGRQAGFSKDSGTRSSLAWETIRIFREKRPKYLLMENVKALVQRKFIKDFNLLQGELEKMGYANFARVLNANDYGVPQNRERVFMVSILRTERDPEPLYYFPAPFPLERRLKDVLEEKVDEKYYLSDKMLEYFERVNDDKSHGHNFKPTDGGATAFTIRTAPGQRVDDNFIYDNQHPAKPRA